MPEITVTVLLPADVEVRARTRRASVQAASIRHPGLAGLDAQIEADGLRLRYLLPDDARPLDDSDIDAAGVLALMSPIAAALALLHDAGIAHGGVHRDHVYATELGYGVLCGWRPGADPAEDVLALSQLVVDLLPSASVGADLAQALVWAADPDPAVRPSMARLAGLLHRSRQAGRLCRPDGDPAHRRSARPGRVVGIPDSAAGAALATQPDVEVPPSPPARRLAFADDVDTAPVPPTRPSAVLAALTRSESPQQVKPPSGRHAAGRADVRRRDALGRASRFHWRWVVAGAGALSVGILAWGAIGAGDASSSVGTCPPVASPVR